MNWEGETKILVEFISGVTNTFTTGFSSDNSILPHAIGNFNLIKTDKGVWVKGFLGIILNMDCIRCLNKLDICIDINIDEEYRYDDFMDKEFDDNFIIDDSNHLSLRECLREYIFVTSPRKPVCKKICKL